MQRCNPQVSPGIWIVISRLIPTGDKFHRPLVSFNNNILNRIMDTRNIFKMTSVNFTDNLSSNSRLDIPRGANSCSFRIKLYQRFSIMAVERCKQCQDDLLSFLAFIFGEGDFCWEQEDKCQKIKFEKFLNLVCIAPSSRLPF